MSTQTPAFTLKHKLLLSIGVPCLILILLEGVAQFLLARGVGAPPVVQPSALEMPTWMLRDANALARAKPSRDAFDWLSLFVEGEGYRVHMIPKASRAVKNTFSLISADQERRYQVTANELGFRGPLVTPKKAPNTYRILVFGDSSSFGWGVNAEDTWWMLLRQELSNRFPGRKIEVANFAIPGDSSAYGKLVFDTFAPRFEADLVILGFGANDAKGVYTSHTQQVSQFTSKRSLLKVVGVLQKSAVVTILKNLLTPPSPATTEKAAATRPLVPAVSVQDYAANMTSMGRAARDLGSKNVVLLGLCTPHTYARKARQAAQENGFLWLNAQNQLIKLLPRIQRKEVYPDYVERMEQRYREDLRRNKLFYVTSDGCHPNELGHRYVADQLAQILTSTQLVQ